jgi:outer membrane protein TolC
MAQKLFAEGIISKYHVLRADVAVADAEASLEDDKNNLELAYLALKSTMGVSQDTTLVLTDSLKYYDFDLNKEASVDSAYSNQPLLQLIDQKKIMVDQKKNLASSKFWPTIFAFGEVGFFRRDFPGIVQPPWMVGIQANWEIFSGFKDYQELQAAKHLENQLLHAKKDAKNKIKLWINKAYTQAVNAKTKYEKSEATIKLAKENLRMCEKRFEEGYGTSLEVIDANMMLEGEKVKRLSALYNYYKALNELFTAAGQPTKIVELISESQNQ